MKTNTDEIMKADKELSKGYYVSNSSNMTHITLHMPKVWIRAIDDMVSKGRNPNRSEAIRHMIRYYFDEYGIDVEQFK